MLDLAGEAGIEPTTSELNPDALPLSYSPLWRAMPRPPDSLLSFIGLNPLPKKLASPVREDHFGPGLPVFPGRQRERMNAGAWKGGTNQPRIGPAGFEPAPNLRTAATPLCGSGGSAALGTESSVRAGRACAKRSGATAIAMRRQRSPVAPWAHVGADMIRPLVAQPCQYHVDHVH